LLGRENELHIYAYHQLEELIEMHLKASQTTLRYPLRFHSIDPRKHERILDHEVADVYTIPLNHNFPTCGFMITEKQKKLNIKKEFIEGKDLKHEDFTKIKDGKDYTDENGKLYRNEDITHPPAIARSYAYCTDTAFDEGIVPMIKDVDLLYHEATFMEDRKADAEAKFHSTAAQAATIAKMANAQQLVIGHYSARYKELDDLLNEARAVFPETVLAQDGLMLEL
jgi:ribonuclease Z